MKRTIFFILLLNLLSKNTVSFCYNIEEISKVTIALESSIKRTFVTQILTQEQKTSLELILVLVNTLGENSKKNYLKYIKHESANDLTDLDLTCLKYSSDNFFVRLLAIKDHYCALHAKLSVLTVSHFKALRPLTIIECHSIQLLVLNNLLQEDSCDSTDVKHVDQHSTQLLLDNLPEDLKFSFWDKILIFSSHIDSHTTQMLKKLISYDFYLFDKNLYEEYLLLLESYHNALYCTEIIDIKLFTKQSKKIISILKEKLITHPYLRYLIKKVIATTNDVTETQEYYPIEKSKRTLWLKYKQLINSKEFSALSFKHEFIPLCDQLISALEHFFKTASPDLNLYYTLLGIYYTLYYYSFTLAQGNAKSVLLGQNTQEILILELTNLVLTSLSFFPEHQTTKPFENPDETSIAVSIAKKLLAPLVKVHGPALAQKLVDFVTPYILENPKEPKMLAVSAS
jgi:hypothetical protein